MRTQIKICGIKTVADAQATISAGADALGLVFYRPSKRYVDTVVAKQICQSVGPFVTTVGLFVDAPRAEVQKICAEVPLQVLQFHGNESASYCESFARPYIKAVRVQNAQTVSNVFEQHPNAIGYILDSYVAGEAGGTGVSFDWHIIPKEFRSRCVLAGGLNPSNVSRAIKRIAPLGVDVSGGVESAAGHKEPTLIAAFCKAVTDTVKE